MTDTRTGRIYKIVCCKSNDTYIGSTFNELRTRMAQHKKSFNKDKGLVIYESFKEHGWNSLRIIQIAEYEVVDRFHMEMYEQLWMNKLRSSNKKMAFNIITSKKKDSKRKEYMPSGCCPCGGSFTDKRRSIHLKTKKHRNWLATQ